MTVVPILAARRDDEGSSPAELHLLNGVSVEHDGPANVSKYFLPTIEVCHAEANVANTMDASAASTGQRQRGEAMERCTGAFRGRLLRGAKVTCEDGYKLYVLEKQRDTADGAGDVVDDVVDDDVDDDVDDRGGEAGGKQGDGDAYRIVGSRKSFTYWKHHVPVDPSTDALYRAMQWVRVAGALHGDCLDIL